MMMYWYASRNDPLLSCLAAQIPLAKGEAQQLGRHGAEALLLALTQIMNHGVAAA